MRAAVLISVLAVALGLPQNAPGASNRQGFFGGNFGPGGRAGQRANEMDWGPKAYGPGLNNPWAFPVNPFVMQRAVSLVDTCPGTLVKVSVEGEVTITDQHGWQVEIVDFQGNDITEGLTEFEHPEPQFVIGGPPGFGAGGFGGFGGFGAGGFGGASAGFNSADGASSGFGGSPGAGGTGFRPPCFRRSPVGFR